MARTTSILCFTGVLLFLLGLATGFVIPALKAPRIGLSRISPPPRWAWR